MEPYGIEPEPTLPELPGEVLMRERRDAVLDAVAADLMIHANNCVRAFGDFHAALSAGSAQTELYMRLMTDPAFREFPWPRTHVWLTREDEVPIGAPGSRFGAIGEILADHAGIPRRHLHAVRWPGGAAAYEAELRETLAWREKGHDRLDAVVLSIEPDGTPAGLVNDAPPEGHAGLIRAHDGRDPHTDNGSPGGVTMTSTLVRATRLIAILGYGDPATAGLARAAEQSGDAFRPIAPDGGTLRWYIDGPALRGEPGE